MIKKCIKCKKELISENFSKNKSKKDGLQNICKSCTKIYKNQHYKQHKKDYIEKNNQLKEKNKKWLITYKKNLECIKCGFKEHPAALDFHHRDPKTKKFHISYMVTHGYSIEVIKEEIKKCDILCANCHRILHS